MKLLRHNSSSAKAAFTMIEIAMALAIIGFALVAIIGILPQGIDVQKDNRRETIINQDANYFVEAIRGGARGLDDLTNYVTAITNYWTFYPTNGSTTIGQDTYTNASFAALALPNSGFNVTSISPIYKDFRLISGQRIVGILSTPKYVPAPDGSGFYSNNIVAYVRAISGSAFEKPPQANDLILGSAFSYRMVSEIVPYGTRANVSYDTSWTNYAEVNVTVTAVNRSTLINRVAEWVKAIRGKAVSNPTLTNYLDPAIVINANLVQERVNRSFVASLLHANMYEARLFFRWPLLPGKDSNGIQNVGNGRQTYRLTMSGSLQPTTAPTVPEVPLYILRSQLFTNLVPYYTNSL